MTVFFACWDSSAVIDQRAAKKYGRWIYQDEKVTIVYFKDAAKPTPEMLAAISRQRPKWLRAA